MPHSRARRRDGTGFTLVEVVVATAVSGLVMSVLVMLLFLTAAAAPTPASPGPQSIQATHGLDELAADLAKATAVLRISPTQLELLLPDLNGDGLADRAQYLWSGTPGQSLFRHYAIDPRSEYGTPRILSAAVDELAFIPDLITTVAATEADGRNPESLIDAYAASGGSRAEDLLSSRSFGQVFVPAVPAGATQFTVSRVSLRLQQTVKTEGAFVLSITSASGGVPSGAALLSQKVAAEDLPRSLDWVDFAFVGGPALPVGPSYAMTLIPVDSARAAVVQWVDDAPGRAGKASTSSDGGSSWTPTTGALLFRVHGHHNATPSTAATPQPASKLVGLTVHLTPSAPGARLVSQYYRALNLPEVP